MAGTAMIAMIVAVRHTFGNRLEGQVGLASVVVSRRWRGVEVATGFRKLGRQVDARAKAYSVCCHASSRLRRGAIVMKARAHVAIAGACSFGRLRRCRFG
jgi:hypothetical protein